MTLPGRPRPALPLRPTRPRLASGAVRPTIATDMTRARRFLLLWLALVLCAPLPFFLVETGRQPVAAIAQMLAVTVALMITEGSGGALPLAAGILGGQILIGALVLALVSIGVLRVLDRTLGEHAEVASVLLVVAIFAAALALPIYRTPFRASGLHATLAEVFE